MAAKPFQAFTIKFSGITDRIVTNVRVMPGFDFAHPPNPLPNGIETTALWDTGASRSVVSTDLVTSLGLTPVGTTKVNHAGGTAQSNTYLVNFGLPNHVGVAGSLVTEFPHPRRVPGDCRHGHH
jgi:hypothetical protein